LERQELTGDRKSRSDEASPVPDLPLPRKGGFRTHPAWKIAAIILTIGALAMVFSLLLDAWPSLVAHRHEIDVSLLAMAFALALGAAYLTFIPFALIVRDGIARKLSWSELAHLYFTSQLLKHLPGRVWGIGYQWAAGGQFLTIGGWLGANFLHMALATFFALFGASIALALGSNWLNVFLVVLTGVVCYSASWSSAHLIRWGAERFFLLRSISVLSATLDSVSPRKRTQIFLLFTASWVVYYASWYLNGLAYFPLGGEGGIRMCAYYMLAWFIGYISLVTPSGLGVRELVFAWLSKDFPADAIALMAVVGRVGLLGVDVVLGLAFSGFSPERKSES
jgi:glycosyltransferase 2 family protein